MKAVEFPEMNAVFGANQPEYQPLPAFAVMVNLVDENTVMHVGEDGKMTPVNTKPIVQSVIACFELSDREIEEIVKTHKIWYTQHLYGGKFQPMDISTKNPFDK